MSLEPEIAKFIEINDRKKKLEALLDAAKEELRESEEKVLSLFEKNGIQKIRIMNQTVYLRRQLWASAANGKPAAVEALKEAGFGDLIEEHFNTQKLSALVREMDKEGTELPESFKDKINVIEKFNIRTRKSQ